uniref:Putative GT4 n=1 Tax=Magnetococcus massalia (strain MO-1) TaxID=451514 RepID=A0A1S7LL00_MAGMO|nr:putative GT4 [Candidatus Magnetococcus massalia]
MRHIDPQTDAAANHVGQNGPRRILIATDAWDPPQVNGVALTYRDTALKLESWGDRVEVIHPRCFEKKWFTIKGDNVEVIRDRGYTARRIDQFAPDHLHIATEGPIGMAAQNHCRKNNIAFTTTYHTQWPEYVERRTLGLVGAGFIYPIMRRFHNRSSGIMATTPEMAELLSDKGFSPPISVWTRGVDTNLFHPRQNPEQIPEPLRGVKKPIYLYVGRLAREKSIDDFLEVACEGTKCVVGEGPDAARLKSKFPDAIFPGLHKGEALAAYYAAADLFVFPSLTDTFGKVLIEALASGTPIAARDHQAPRFILGKSGAGVAHADMATAMQQALEVDPAICLKRAKDFSIDQATQQFRDNLVPCRPVMM